MVFVICYDGRSNFVNCNFVNNNMAHSCIVDKYARGWHTRHLELIFDDKQHCRWSRIPREKRLCACGAIQTEEHVICFCPLSDHVRSEITFALNPPLYPLRITQFFECEDVPRLRYVCRRIVSVYEWICVGLYSPYC